MENAINYFNPEKTSDPELKLSTEPEQFWLKVDDCAKENNGMVKTPENWWNNLIDSYKEGLALYKSESVDVTDLVDKYSEAPFGDETGYKYRSHETMVAGDGGNYRGMTVEHTSDNNEYGIENTDSVVDKIEKSIGSSDGIKELIEKHPEKSQLWQSQLEAIETLNNPDATDTEIRSAQAKLSILKGQITETAVKDAFSDVGFDVEAQQRVVDGESGGTRPDVIAVNKTNQTIEVFGINVQPGEKMSVECKCGRADYLTSQLNNHIPNQLSGQEGIKVLLTTSDIIDVKDGLATSVCNKYESKLVSLNLSVSNVETAIKEVSRQ